MSTYLIQSSILINVHSSFFLTFLFNLFCLLYYFLYYHLFEELFSICYHIYYLTQERTVPMVFIIVLFDINQAVLRVQFNLLFNFC